MKNESEVRAKLRGAGVSEEEIEKFISDFERVRASLDLGICPQCNQPGISRAVDPRQAGSSELAGTWFNYRCTCGFMLDAKEEPG